MKRIRAQFSATAKNGKMAFANPEHHLAYCTQFEGKEFIVKYDEKNSLTEKQRMYNYLHSTLIDCAIQALEQDGWEGVDEATAYHYLKMYCAKETRVNKKTGTEMEVFLDMKEQPKDRLLKFINDSIFLLESRHAMQVPDSTEYKMKLASGIEFKKLK